tara:strand:+ start:1983 stop:2396 length:414 start_codon:yes stop_codon:yes gene_type:complete
MPRTITYTIAEEIFKIAPSEIKKFVETELKFAALSMEGRSKQLGFSRFKNRTGRLRQSIAGRFIKGDDFSVVLSAGGHSGGKDVFYAKYIEYGTKRNGKRAITPRLFLSRSRDEELKTLKPNLDKGIAKILMGKKNG